MTKSDKIWGWGALIVLSAILWFLGDEMEAGPRITNIILVMLLSARLGYEQFGEKANRKDEPI